MVWAQHQLVFEPVHDERGNSVPEVTFVYQDQAGFMWFGSTTGLYRYDGRKTIVFRHDVKNKNSLLSSYIWQMCEDSKHRLWISTQKGLTMLDSGRKVFTKIFPEKDNAEHQRKPFTNALLIDRNDQLWFCSDFGLHHINTKTGEQKIFPIHNFTPYIPRHRGTGTIREDRDYLWIATTTGICRFNKKDLTWRYFLDKAPSINELPLHNTIQDLFIENDTLMWVSCWGGGIKKFNPIKETFQTYVYEKNVPPHQWGTVNIARNILFIRTGNEKKYWVATLDRTLAQFDPKNGTFHFIDDKNSKGFDVGPVNGIWYAGGLMWMATNAELYKVNPEPPLFKPVRFDQLLIKQQGMEMVTLLASDHALGVLYIYTYGKELLRWDYKTNKLNTIPHRIKAEISLLHVLPGGKLLIGADGLYVYDPVKNTFQHINKNYGSEASAFYFKKGCYLIATFRNGIRLWCEGKDDLLPLITSRGESLTQKYPALYCAIVARDRKLWLATHLDGLVCYDSATDKTKVYKTTPEGIPLSFFYWIAEDEEGKIWACSSDGLICIDKGVIVKHYSTADGLPTDAVHKVVLWQDNAWISTKRGLVHLDKEKNKITTYNRQHDLEKDNLFFTDIALLNDGRMAVGESGRILILDSTKQKGIQTPPKTVVTSIRITGKEQEITKDLILMHEQNQISFEFAALNYVTPQLHQYAYKLNGADRDWNYSGNTNSANYAGLAPGHYSFRVKGSTNSSRWSDETIFSFTIQPPFWQTWWFRTVITISVAGLIYLVYRYRVAQLIKLQQIRNGIASDLHDDIGSALTTISLFSEAAKQHSLPAGLPLIEQMGVTSRRVLEDMNDIVWAISPKNDAFKNLFERMRLLGNQLFGAAHIEFRIEAEAELIEGKLSMAHRKNLYLIYKEALNNSVKYASATCVEVSIKRAAKGAILLIHDNGKGFDPGSARHGNGLENMKLRARQMNGVLTLQSELGKGTTIQLYFNSTTNGR